MSRLGTITVDLNDIINKTTEARQKAKDEGDQIVAKVTAENREFTKEENEALVESQTKFEAADNKLKLYQRQLKQSEAVGAGGESRTRQDGNLNPKANADDEKREKQTRQRKAFGNYLRYGTAGLDNEERQLVTGLSSELPASREARALSSILGSAGGFLVPEVMANGIETAMKAYSGVLQTRAMVLNTESGGDIPWPTTNDTDNEGEQIEENKVVTEKDTTFGSVTLKAYVYSSKAIRLPLILVQDSLIDIEALITRIMAERLGRIINRRLTTGTGANQPLGIVTGSTLGKQAASGTAVTYDELIDVQHSVDPAYRGEAEWQFNDSTMAALRKLKDSDGRPIWLPNATGTLANGAPGLLLDRPYRINTHMESMASGKRSIVFGDHSKYMVRRVGGITMVRLAERYADFNQVGFFGFARFDGRPIDAGTNPLKHLVHP